MFKKIIKYLRRGSLAGLLLPLYSRMVLAVDETGSGEFSTSQLATGTKQLLNDVGNWLLGISLVVGGVVVTYFLIRRAAADEVDGKMWMKRTVIAVVCSVAGAISGTIISIVASYYGA